MNKKKKNSFASNSLKYKLRLVLYLMLILPILVSIYIVSNYVIPNVGPQVEISLSIIISIAIALIGFFLVKQVFDRVLNISSEAKMIAAGDIDRKLDILQDDEVGILGDSLNQLTNRIRSNMDELKNYSEQTTKINFEIQKRILVLSSLLQISSLITQSANLDDIIKLTIEKSRSIANSEIAYLFFKEEKSDIFIIKSADGVNVQHLLKLKIDPENGIFSRMIKTNRPMILDKNNQLPAALTEQVESQFRINNMIALPIYLRGKIIGIVGVGNSKEEFVFEKDDIELLDIFAKQVAIAVENDILMHRIEKLEIKDALTGLYNEAFIRNRLQEEIKRAVTYQRPCAFVIINIDNFQKFHQNYGSLKAEATLKKVASLIRDSVTEIDRVGRIEDNEFAIVLPERNKRQAQTIAEEIRRKIEYSYSEEQDASKKLTVSGGISENPLDGVTSDELFNKAKNSLRQAKKEGKNKITG